MKQIIFSTDHAPIAPVRQHYCAKKISPEIARIALALQSGGYQSPYALLNLCNDVRMHTEIQKASDMHRAQQPALMILIGIGGSNLGTMAVEQALQGFFARDAMKMPVYYADTVDSVYTKYIYQKAESCLQSGQSLLLVIISKSGTTLETIANAQLFVSLYERYKPHHFHKNIVLISDEDSPFASIAQAHQCTFLPIPHNVGGRFSVLSAVGLFPLAMMGIDIKALCAGAASIQSNCINSELSKNYAAMSAATLYFYYTQGLVIHDFFAFSQSLFKLGDWYRQLLAESIGKEKNNAGEIVECGITPTISIGSIDLHSQAQLALAGPHNRLTTFITIDNQEDIAVPDGFFSDIVPGIRNTSYNAIMDAIFQGTQKAYANRNRPFMTIRFPQLDSYGLGQFMQFKMAEIIYLGYLFDINPFDQPHVELYKKETRKILAYE